MCVQTLRPTRGCNAGCGWIRKLLEMLQLIVQRQVRALFRDTSFAVIRCFEVPYLNYGIRWSQR